VLRVAAVGAANRRVREARGPRPTAVGSRGGAAVVGSQSRGNR
jgi:hypothetical protein